VIYIDDVFAFPYDVDALINYNIYSSEARYRDIYLNINLPKLYLGPMYVPLRKEFKNVHIELNERVENVFISTGGSDEPGLVLKIIDSLRSKPSLVEEVNYHFVIGSYEPDIERINELSLKYPWINIHRNVTDMAGLMSRCDIAVSAAGSTLYELCSCGIPTITYVLADNQIDGAREFEARGLMLSAGDLRETDYDCESIIQLIQKLVNDNDLRMDMHRRIVSLIDDKGAYRIVEDILR
jgi:spore coat polysaccharide biosynthesis predicted glycosyltransferase SpsG